MDKSDALRLAVFEYLLPAQRTRRVEQLARAFSNEQVDLNWTPERHPAGVFEELHRISEQLLISQGFPSSYTYPKTMHHENGELSRRLQVNALIDSDGPFVWDPNCRRRADPPNGIRVFRPGAYMSAGRLVLTRQ